MTKFFHFHSALLSMGILMVSASWAQTASAAKLQGYDAIVAQGEVIHLSAKLERYDRWWLNPDLEDEPVDFYDHQAFLGRAITNEDGVATLEIANAYPVGVHEFTARTPSGARYQAISSPLVIAVETSDRPIAICDIDHTIADISGLDFLSAPVTQIPELPGSIEALQKISEEFRLVFLTARDDAFMKKTRQWLTYKGFPKAPVYYWDLGEDSLSHTKYKTQRIKELSQTFSQILVGFGDKEGDAKAYRKNGLRAYILNDEDDDFPKGTIFVESWAEILAHLEGHPIEPHSKPDAFESMQRIFRNLWLGRLPF